MDIQHGDARCLPLDDSSVDAILTSPPYAVTLDYIKNDVHAFQALGYNPIVIRDNFIGVRGNKKIKLIYIWKISGRPTGKCSGFYGPDAGV